MVSTSDFISLDYSADLTEAGIAYTRKSFTYMHDPIDEPEHGRLRRVIAGVAVELAFRRYLNRMDIPHSNLDATPFTDPDRLDIIIGGRRCDIKLSMMTQKSRIRQAQKNPGILLGEGALVTRDQIASGHMDDEDLYIFAFLLALVTPNLRSLDQAVRANQPVFLVHALPAKWSRRDHWGSLGKLAINGDVDDALNLGLDGLDAGRKFQTEQITLYPGTESTGRCDFYALRYLHAFQLPKGTLRIHSPITKATHLIRPVDWGNIWVYGLQITLAGYVTCGEFRSRAGGPLGNNRHSQYPKTPTGHRLIPVSDLHPLRDLFRRAKTWDENRYKPHRFP
jgi:hypothetical protein